MWIDRLKRAWKIGVTMAYGTDVIDDVPGMTRGTETMRGIEPWIEAGMPAPVLAEGDDDERGATARRGRPARRDSRRARPPTSSRCRTTRSRMPRR